MEYDDAVGVDTNEEFVIDVDTTDAVEMGPVPAGEYKLQCVKAEAKSGEGKNGPWKGVSLLFDIPDEISAALVSHMIFLPNESQTEKQKAQAVGQLKVFKEAFGFGPTETFRPHDLVGKEVWATLTVKDDPEYGAQNRVQRFVPGQ